MICGIWSLSGPLEINFHSACLCVTEVIRKQFKMGTDWSVDLVLSSTLGLQLSPSNFLAV